MPIYEYRCLHCGHTFEKLQPLKEEPVAACPECGKPAEKVMSASVGYVIKGVDSASGGRWARNSDSCCGQSSPCEHPKRCCTK